MTARNQENHIVVQHEPPLAWVIINRPAACNALTTAMWGELAMVLRTLGADEQIRVILLRGAGDKSFIAGADIADLQAQLAQPDVSEAGYQFTVPLLTAISTVPQPVVAMINGHCLGGGMLIALTCDLRLASTAAQFGIPAVKLGVAYPPEHGVARLVQAVGATQAADLLLTGRTVDASEALRMGLINRIVPPAELVAATQEYGWLLAQGAPLALSAHKAALHQLLPSPHKPAELAAAVQRCYRSEDCREGLAAFLEKRPPRFTGK